MKELKPKTRECYACKKQIKLENFHNSKSGKWGKGNICVKCDREKKKKKSEEINYAKFYYPIALD